LTIEASRFLGFARRPFAPFSFITKSNLGRAGSRTFFIILSFISAALSLIARHFKELFLK